MFRTKNNILTIIFIFVYMLGKCTCQGARVEVRGYFQELVLSFPQEGPGELNSDQPAWQQVPFPAEPSCCCPKNEVF